MKIIFGTTSYRKISDLQNVINELGLDYTVIGLNKLKGWQGEIEENGNTIEENSQIKADAIREFCEANSINLPIITDDAGLFVEVLGDEPGVKTSRYADDERAANPYLPDYQCVYKLLDKIRYEYNRSATYKCCVTCILPNEEPFQIKEESEGFIAFRPIGKMKKPYFYSVFILENTNKPFSELNEEELKETYRYKAMRKALKELNYRLENTKSPSLTLKIKNERKIKW